MQCGCSYDQTDPCEFFTRCQIEGGKEDDYYYDYDVVYP